MNVFRNKELRTALLWFAVTGLLLSVAGFFVSPVCGVLLLAASGCFTLLHLWFTKRRYQSIAALCRSIDRVLHAQDSVLISDNTEGELSILNSEIQKMTLRLKEQTDLLQQDKLQLKTAIEDIFHQLRTPLTAMQLSLSLLREEELTDARRLALTRELKNQLDRIGQLVETLLKLSKIDAGTAQFQSRTVRVCDLVTQAATPFTIPMEVRRQSLSVQVGDASFCGDLLWTSEALGNLIKNCMEHTPDGGVITVTAEENALYTQITVADTGEGIPEADLPQLFERFYKGKNAAPGSIGIGLALTQAIVTAQNGTITAANRPEGGAVFTVRFYKTVV